MARLTAQKKRAEPFLYIQDVLELTCKVLEVKIQFEIQ